MEYLVNYFSILSQEPEDPIYGLQVAFKKDPRPTKINLSIGVFPEEGNSGAAFRFPVITAAEEQVLQQQFPKSYLPIDGLPAFCKHTANLLFGNTQDNAIYKSYTAQTIGGTAALHIGAKLLAKQFTKHIFISNPTWVNHRPLFEACGMQVGTYPYEVTPEGHLHIDAITKAIHSMPKGSVIVLQASCHNPTGIDPTQNDWKRLQEAIADRGLITFFDIAYQGLGRGLEEDAWPIRLFLEKGHEMLIATSFAKNFGLYCDRVGALTIVAQEQCIAPIASQIRKIIRSIYSSPAAHGAHIVTTIFENPVLLKQWHTELKKLRDQLQIARDLLHAALEKKNCSIKALKTSTGLFCLTGLEKQKILQLRADKAIYLGDDSRINIAALQPNHIDIIAEALSTA